MELMKHDVQMVSCDMMYIQIFMKIDTCVQAILIVCCNVGVTGDRDLRVTPLR
jgi:hypothetical protein